MSFLPLGLSEPLLRVLAELGYCAPFPIQIEAIPAILSGRDVMAAAQTGTGKTAGFTLPLLQRLAGGARVRPNHIRALVLAPTRELAAQVGESVAAYAKYLPLKSAVVYGGVKINPQMMKLRSGVDVLVATPGRLLDLFSQNAVRFSQVETLVLDEADRMLDMGFLGDIRKILALLPQKRQNLLFSATFSDEIRNLTAALLKNPVQIEVGPPNTAAQSVEQRAYEVDRGKKSALLSFLVRSNGWEQVLVFARTKIGADRLVQKLDRDGLSAAAIHGDKSQGERTRALADFKAKRIRVLVATDLAARGLDIRGLPQVINFELPKVPEDYIHRIGRTGRAGSQGEAISLVSAEEVQLLSGIETLLQQLLPREVVPGFVPTEQVPLTRQLTVHPKKPKKPKRERGVP
ncbi:ATP-dependent RNA helicase RhlE [Desulfuromonas soudanensis]|uniref:DEAD-box ATP-dependent RNA helicase RhpA n=1 Tax=Desulfuromonas soudanensis TaxID=1603606 RepID=A0A0M3QG70_9BACT|nr:DEAD/DEAH box helicase [Desulfuromonas soudanensis]ALC17293.1 ATP-dependent RNA helicase RhlE [Desulfuromonas soudanensis]